MKASELQISNFLQAPNVQFVIPVYQRNYDWTHSECKQLLNDIIDVERHDRGVHFIGSVVFITEGFFNIGKVKELLIIDGQQRLTTINILYVALYRFAKENDMQKEAERIYNMFLTNQYVQNETSKLKLKQTDTSSIAFKAIMNGNENGNLPYSNVIENYNYFKGIINEELFQTILNGLDRLIFVEISLERDKDDPQRIFESLNSTGLDLSESDLIRNFILMDLPPKEQNKIFETIWNPIEENAKDLKRQKSMVSDYIRDYLTLRTKKIPNKNKVYLEFKRQYPDKRAESFYQELENIKSLSFHYKKFINPTIEKDKEIRKELEYISRIEINVAYPFLLQVFEDKENGLIDKSVLIQILKLIQSYTWRRFIVGLPTNALNKIFMTLYGEVEFDDYYNSIAVALLKKKGSAKFPTNEEVKSALKDKDIYTAKAKNRNYFFELLENHENREYVNTHNELITIEHIFPQNPTEEWSEKLSQTDYFDFKEKYLHTIANLTLSGNNGALSNKSFQSKKMMNIDGKEQGYNYSRLWLNKYLSKIDHWDIEAMQQRFNLLYDRFIKVWFYPDVQIEEISQEDEINIYDAEAPTFKKLEYFIFEDNKIETDAIAQMYFYVIGELYKRNAQLLISNQDILKITRNKNDFRSPQEVVNNWFIEANIDSNSKFKVLKKLLTLFELEEELIIKYRSDEVNSKTANRHIVRKKYWQHILQKIENTHLFENVSASKDHWLSTGAGKAGIAYTMVVSRNFARIELTIGSSSKEKNKKYFKNLFNHKTEIEEAFGSVLEWEELPDNKMSRIKIEDKTVNVFNEESWPEMDKFFIENLPKFEKAFSPFIEKLK
ncbi:MAG TPA: DUF4268 domain-containing protein [Salinivirga sp.]|uniref:DUF4268 domain-containing protein n=1 Tax=Salinivirga sp. TaxID=1970192 RepID=UPI002B4A9C66|nr:DUF4268 domain-containing protein [Salinivirga sp.]HKK59728.1 DUF4268 domain-containing protein [Salinivirga sp.]